MEILDITKANAEIGTLQASLKTAQDELATVKASVASFEIKSKELNQSLETLKETHKSEIAKLNSEFEVKLNAEKELTAKAKQSAVDESIKIVASQGIDATVSEVKSTESQKSMKSYKSDFKVTSYLTPKK